MKKTDFDVALATCQKLPEPDADAEILDRALAAAGITARTLAWDDPDAAFARAKIIVVRSTWNYHLDRDRFLAWIDTHRGKLENHMSVLRWNTHKRYLRELDEGGLPTVETVLVPKASGVSLQAVMKKKHWFRAVCKPAVGAGSVMTRVTGGSREDEEAFAADVQTRDMLVQPYIAEVETHGERAIVFIDGEVTHAVRKSPRFAGDAEHTEAVAVADDERALALRAMHWTMRNFPCGALLYGRADMVRDGQGALRLMELELTEPSLFLAHAPHAVERFVQGLQRRLALVPGAP